MYGYAVHGDEASPEQELRYIEEVRKKYYAALSGTPANISSGRMSYEELDGALAREK